jgi:glucose/arabinose dehydrogenase
MFRLRFVLCLSLLVAACAPVAPMVRSTQVAVTQVVPAPSPTQAPPPTSQPRTPPPTSQPQTSTPTSVPVPSATPVPPGPFQITLERIVSGLARPTYVTHAGDGTGRLFVVEQPGRIRIMANGQLVEQPFLDITNLVSTNGNERGLFSVAFHPQYAANGQFFVDYTRRSDGATVIARYKVSPGDPNVAALDSATPLLLIPQPQANHNGGQLQFGPDGYLYIGMGDGGGQGDQHGSIGNGQALTTLLGKLLRIDVTDVDTYTVPASNPFARTPNARPEIWAFGLRNPWRFSFDRGTGALYIADVGQDAYEEVDVQPASSKGGENYGWRIMEGDHCYNPQNNCDRSGLTMPIVEYSHAVGGCSVTGGYVYRGSAYPWLDGVYFFGDYCSGLIWSLARDASGKWEMTQRLDSGLSISSFGEDEPGELYVVDLNGAVYRLKAK